MLKTILAVCSLAPIVCGCTAPTTTDQREASPEVVESLTRYRKEYVLAAGDSIDVIVRGQPELTRSLVIRPDGFITLPITSDVQAEGRTPRELGEELTRSLAKRVLDPEVTVIATATRPAMVYVFGEVAVPAPVEFRRAATAAQAVANAGGFKDSASRDNVSIIRLNDQGHLQAIPIMDGLVGQPAHLLQLQTTRLQADDIVFVPETGIAQWNYFIQNYVNQPLSGVNTVLNTWTQFRLIQLFEESL